MTAREWSLLLLLAVVWGGAFSFVAVALQGFRPVTLIVLRLLVASGVLLIVMRAMHLRAPDDRRIWRDFLFMGAIANLIPFALLATAQTRIGGGLAAILNSSMPLWTALLAHVFTADERLSGRRLAGVVVGVAGVSIMIGGDALASIGADVWPQLVCVAAAMCYGAAGVFGRRFRDYGLHPVTATAGTACAAGVLGVPMALLIDRPWTQPAPDLISVAAVVGIGVFSTAAGYIVYFRILGTAGAMNASLVTFLVPVSAIVLGVSFLGETLAAQHIVGMGVIFAGLALIDGRALRWLRRRLRD